MADNSAKALEAVAVTAGKALDTVNGLGRFIARVLGDVPTDAVGVLGGVALHHSRIRNLDRLQRETDRILAERNLPATADVPGVIAIALLSAAQDESRPELQEIWATLLANAMDPARAGDMRVQFVETLKQFHPRDVLVLRALRDFKQKQYQQVGDLQAKLKLPQLAVEVSLEHLIELKCAVKHGSLNTTLRPYGRELLSACE